MIIDKSIVSQLDLETFKKSNYKMKTDDVDFSDIIVKKPWGYEYLFFENDDIAIWILNIEPNQKTSLHCHPNKNTSLICLSSEIECKTLDNSYSFTELNGIYLGKKVYHQTLNNSNTTALVMEIESPVNKFDLSRVKDDYGRSSKTYESRENYRLQKELTLKDISSKPFIKKFDNLTLELGFAKDKNKLSIIYNLNNDKVIATILNRHIWSTSGIKSHEVGQLFELNKEMIVKSNINDNFTYLKISKD
jgi:hypothetical protein